MPLGANKAAIMGVAGVSTETVVLLYDQDASSDASLEITSGITSAYSSYVISWYNCNPETDGVHWQFQANASGESGYNETITNTYVEAYYGEAGGGANVAYVIGRDQAQGTGYIDLSQIVGSDADQSCAGELQIFNPSSTTYVTNFISRCQMSYKVEMSIDCFVGGYFNTTAALTNLSFKMSSGDFDGTVKMWGVK